MVGAHLREHLVGDGIERLWVVGAELDLDFLALGGAALRLTHLDAEAGDLADALAHVVGDLLAGLVQLAHALVVDELHEDAGDGVVRRAASAERAGAADPHVGGGHARDALQLALHRLR